MDRETRTQICELNAIHPSSLDEPPSELMKHLSDVSRILVQSSPPEDADACVLLKASGIHRWIRLKETLTIGAADDNDVVLDDAYLSGHHAKIEARDGVWILKDLNSTNGLSVNKSRVMTKCLVHGDIIQIGGSTLVFALKP